MANATCSSCNAVYDTRSMRACPQCMDFICVKCGEQQNGLCPNCDAQDE